MSAWTITLKDLRLLVGDKRALVLLLLLPMVFIAIVGMSTGQLLTRSDAKRKLKLAIADLSHTDYSKSLVERYQARDGLEVRSVDSGSEALSLVDFGHVDASIVIGKDFEEKIDTLGLKDVLDPDHGRLGQGLDQIDLDLELRQGLVDGEMLRASLLADILRVVGPIVGRGNAFTRRFFMERPPGEDSEADNVADQPSADAVAAVQDALDAPPKLKTHNSADVVYLILVPGFTVMFVFFLINIMARSFIAERDLGTLERLRLAPVSAAGILLGKTIPFYLVSLLQVAALFLAGRALFGMSWGSAPTWLIPMAVCTSLAATSLGLLLATIVRTDQQVSAYGTSMVIIMAALSGCFMPRDWLPPLMQKVSLATPHAWALRGFDAILSHRTVDTGKVMIACGVLLAFSAIYFAIGCLRFRAMGRGH